MHALVIRSSCAWSVSAGFALFSFLAFSSIASAQQQTSRTQEAIKNQELNRLIQIASLTVCNLAGQKVKFDLALGASAGAVSAYISQVHGGKIEDAPSPLEPKQVFDGVADFIAIESYRRCKNLVPAELAKNIEELRKRRESQPN